MHGVVKKTGCETFVINFEDNANHVVSGVPPKRLRPLKKTPHRLKVRPREIVQEQQQTQQQPGHSGPENLKNSRHQKTREMKVKF